MPEGKSDTPRAGFQGSETSSAEVLLYSQGGDPILLASEGNQELAGQYRTDPKHTLLNVTTTKPLEGTGSFQVTVKPSRVGGDTLLDQIVDDDWVDIIFHRHGREWHTMRGLVDDVRRTRMVAGSGATSWAYTITGRDFQKIFEITPMWFNRFTAKVENVTGELSTRVFSHIPGVGGDPLNTVKNMLLGWFKELAGFGRATWKIPANVPNTKGTFYEDILAGFDSTMFSNVPARVSIDPSFMNPQGNLWQLAKEWADPAFLELFCDLGKKGYQLGPDEELSLDDSTIGVFFRDKPFVLSSGLVDDKGAPPPAALGIGGASAWFALPLHIIPRQQIVNDDVGRSGAERLNAFFVSPQVGQELIKQGPVDMLPPMWDAADIELHGLRRYDIMTRYKAEAGTLLTLSSLQRGMVRDWYAINPYLLNGTIALGVGRPDIHVGTRVRIPGDNGDTAQDETYYVENVTNTWTFGPGMKTNLNVTRGWQGNDNSLVQAVTDLANRYSIPPVGEGGS